MSKSINNKRVEAIIDEIARKHAQEGLFAVRNDDEAGEVHWAMPPEQVFADIEKNAKKRPNTHA